MNKIYNRYFLYILLVSSQIYAQPQNLKFEHIGREDGLTASSVLSILQDHQGFMWFGTTDGLFRYDGYRMTVFRNDPLDSTTLGNNHIWSLLEDSYGTIWIGTSAGGLNRFDRNKEQFIRYTHDPDDPNTISSDVVFALYQDRSGALWVGSWEGLNKIDLDLKKITQFVHDPENTASLNPNRIRSICEDSSGSIWLGTEGGLSRLDVQTGKFERFVADPNNPHSLSSNGVNSVMTDMTGTLWVGSLGGLDRFDSKNQRFTHFATGGGVASLLQDQSGALWIGTGKHLLHFEPETERFTEFQHDPEDATSLINGVIQSVYEDRSGALWFGTNNAINRLDRRRWQFKQIGHNPRDASSLSNNRISALHAGLSGTIWVASWGDLGVAIDKIDPETKHVSRSLPGLKKEHLQPGGGITHLHEDHSGMLWISQNGLGRYDPKNGKFTRFVHESGNPNSLTTNEIECSYEDQNGTLWVAIYHYGANGVSVFEREHERFRFIRFEPKIRSNISPKKGITFISQGRSGKLWFATKGEGIFLLNPGSEEFEQITHEPGNPNSLSHSWVRVVLEDRQGMVWAAPWFGGLNKYNPETGRFTIYTESDGLPSNDITNLVEDDNGNIWLTTQHAVSRFDPRAETFKNFDRDDGLINESYHSWKCAEKSKTGELFFGGENGIDFVHPDSIYDNLYIPPVVFTRFVRYNSSEASGKAIAEKGISEKHRFDLSYKDHTLTFEFAALNYRAPHKNQYAYKLEGFHDDWIHLGTKHEVTLTNIEPGEYILRVKGSNNDGVWNEKGASLIINISPPWWRVGWAFAIYAFLFAVILYGVRRFELKRTQLKNELERKNFEAQKLQEVDSMKSRFFADISHEFRTPISLILGPFEKVLTKIRDSEVLEDLHIMQRNARRLQRLVEQLLDLSRIEARRMPLRAQQDNIVPKIREWSASFVSLAESKNITLNLHFPEHAIFVFFDSEKLEKIVYNLLSNAFKFTPEAREITVTAGSDVSRFKFSVRDTGIGISPQQVEHVFDRFYRASDALTGEQGGTGIGLALAKEFVELHHGEIRVESEPGKGSTFTVLLPLGREHLSDDEIVEGVMDGEMAQPSQGSFEEMDAETVTESDNVHAVPKTERPVVLIIEDNEDMRRHLRNCLAAEFELIETENGEAGLQAAHKKLPDLVVSDVMMPVMDGIVLCEKLKTDQRISHIPVILLTARAGQMDKLVGLETGADDYLTKPFDARELNIRAKNLIEQRRNLRERFSREVTIKPSEITVTSIDEQFLQQAIEIVEQNIANSAFDIDQFCKNIAMSRSTLNRKLRALTGSSTNEFIRILRLKRAAQLLQQKNATIVEIAYEVGFNNPSWFAECFREQFGTSPSEYNSQ
ncbi:MAG: response regulator [Calditrichaeota bacterium]|nr:MAG: response regulator [Calditrichota bacterium]